MGPVCMRVYMVCVCMYMAMRVYMVYICMYMAMCMTPEMIIECRGPPKLRVFGAMFLYVCI